MQLVCRHVAKASTMTFDTQSESYSDHEYDAEDHESESAEGALNEDSSYKYE